jgi:diacylglycerol kinase
LATNMIKLGRLMRSFVYAFKGLKKTFKEEQNIRIQTFFGVAILILAFFLKITRIELSIIIFLVVMVILMELANSAVERIADVLKPRINSYIKEIKDIMAAAVLLASLMSIVIGALIFGPYILEIIGFS